MSTDLELMPQPDGDPLAAALEEIRAAVAASDALFSRMPVDVREFNASQDKLAECVRPLLAALDAVLRLPAQWDAASDPGQSALEEDRTWVRQACAADLREAITRELTEKKAGAQ